MTNTQRLTISIEVNHHDQPYLFVFPHGCATQDVVEAFNKIASELNNMIENAMAKSKEKIEEKPQEVTAEIVS